MHTPNVATPSAPQESVAAPSKMTTVTSTVPSGAWGELDCVDVGVLAQQARAFSKTGKLPGYRAGSSSTGDLFSFHGFGEPWDHEVRAIADSGLGGSGSGGQSQGGRCRVRFVARVLRKGPMIFAAISVFSIWPGAWLTDSMLKAYFPSYSWNTYLWYLPLTVLPLPWMAWRMWTRSRAAAYSHAQDKIAMLREAKG